MKSPFGGWGANLTGVMQRATAIGTSFQGVFDGPVDGLVHPAVWHDACADPPFYPQSNGKMERFHQSLKRECIRPKTPLSLEQARRVVTGFVERYNNGRLHSAIGYLTPKDKLEGRAEVIFAERRRKLQQAKENRKFATKYNSADAYAGRVEYKYCLSCDGALSELQSPSPPALSHRREREPGHTGTRIPSRSQNLNFLRVDEEYSARYSAFNGKGLVRMRVPRSALANLVRPLS